jgi:hypothetical protein
MGDSPWCKAHAGATADRKLPADLHMADSSAVVLKTDISSLVI